MGMAMKLPEYDNRPAPGAPLYDESASTGGEWDDIKFTFLGVVLPIGTLLGFGAAVVLLLLALFN